MSCFGGKERCHAERKAVRTTRSALREIGGWAEANGWARQAVTQEHYPRDVHPGIRTILIERHQVAIPRMKGIAMMPQN